MDLQIEDVGALGAIKKGSIALDKDITIIINKGESSSKPLLAAFHLINICNDLDAFKLLVRKALNNVVSEVYVLITKSKNKRKIRINNFKSILINKIIEVVNSLYGGLFKKTDLLSLLDLSCLSSVIRKLDEDKLFLENEVEVSFLSIDPSKGTWFDSLSINSVRIPYKVYLNHDVMEIEIGEYKTTDFPGKQVAFEKPLVSVLEQLHELLMKLLLRSTPEPLSQGLLYVVWNSEETALKWVSRKDKECSVFRYETLDFDDDESPQDYFDILYSSYWKKVSRSYCHYKLSRASKVIEERLCKMEENLKYLIRGKFILRDTLLYVLKSETYSLKFLSPYIRRLAFTGLALTNVKERALVIIEDLDCCTPLRSQPLLGLAVMIMRKIMGFKFLISVSSPLVTLPLLLQDKWIKDKRSEVTFDIYELNNDSISKVEGNYLEKLKHEMEFPNFENYVKMILRYR